MAGLVVSCPHSPGYARRRHPLGWRRRTPVGLPGPTDGVPGGKRGLHDPPCMVLVRSDWVGRRGSPDAGVGAPDAAQAAGLGRRRRIGAYSSADVRAGQALVRCGPPSGRSRCVVIHTHRGGLALQQFSFRPQHHGVRGGRGGSRYFAAIAAHEPRQTAARCSLPV